MIDDTYPNLDQVRSAEADISFLAPGSFINRRFVSAGIEVNTGRYESHRVPVYDGRSLSDWFTLDRNGFVLAEHRSAVKDFHDNDELNRVYVEEALDVVRNLTGADLVTGRGWMVRTLRTGASTLAHRRQAVSPGPRRRQGAASAYVDGEVDGHRAARELGEAPLAHGADDALLEHGAPEVELFYRG